ncbi:MAG: TRAP transporter small permease subunit [Gammaproteobacteria bacterium]|nr:TRAP transporter small permease subunit [Gammaproteobacteria bacterium]
MLNLLRKSLARFIDWMGVLIAIVMLMMLFTIFYDVVMRYLFNDVSIGMQELEWHLFSCVFLFGVGYSLKENAHVRVDIFYEKLSIKVQAIINIIGTLVFLIPFCSLVIYYGIDFVSESYQLGETSGDPGGLAYRWLIKAAIPASFSFTILCGLYVILEQIDQLRGHHVTHDNPPAV